jgi:DNA polymerase-1
MQEGMAILPILETIQRNGMPVSISRIRSLHSEMQSELDALNLKIYNSYWTSSPVSSLDQIPKGQGFNPKSPQMVASLCRRLGIKPALRTAKGLASTSKKSIEEYRFTEPAIADVFDWRERQHNRDTYCNDVISRIPPGYNQDLLTIHSNIGCTKIPTRRWNARNPNILGIPSRTDLGIKVRDCYIAPPGKLWAGFDLSGIEVRCLTHLSRDPLWINAFRNGINPHLDTASRLFKIPLEQVSKIQKAVAKTVNFLIIYGGGANNLFDQLRSNGLQGYTLDDCKKLIRDWYETYHYVYEYRQRVIAQSKRTETATDYWGMTRHLPGINCGDKKIEGEEGRAAVSQEVQGLAAGCIRNAMIYLWPVLASMIKSRLLDPQCWRLMIHDELIYIANKGEEEALSDIVLYGLTQKCGIDLIVPIEAESHYGETWGECK